MTTKVFEIRDVGTFIPVLAIKLDTNHGQEQWLLQSAGYGKTKEEQQSYILLVQIAGGTGKSTCDPFEWGQNPRTYFIAHKYIKDNFDVLPNGDVVDVQYILEETKARKISERSR